MKRDERAAVIRELSSSALTKTAIVQRPASPERKDAMDFDEHELEAAKTMVMGLWFEDLCRQHERWQARQYPPPPPPRPQIVRTKDDIEKEADKLREKWAADLARRVREGSQLRYSRIEAERLFSELQSPSIVTARGPVHAPVVVIKKRRAVASRASA